MMLQIDPNILLVVVAALNTITAILTWLTHKVVTVAQTDVVEIKKATNSMAHALVEATAKASEAKGRDEERTRAELKAADVRSGKET